MKITFIPDYRKDNSYQTNLANSISNIDSSLSNTDSSVYFSNGYFAIPKSIIRSGLPDILHLHWHHPFLIADNKYLSIIKSVCFICQLLLLRLMGVKMVWTVHNITGHKRKSESIELFFSKYLAKICDRLIVHCSSAKQEVIGKYYTSESSIVVIQHGNYIGQYENTIKRSDARNKLCIKDEDIVFLYFGQIRQYKGISELLNAFKMLDSDTIDNIKLLIVGKSYDEKITEQILNSHNDNKKIIPIIQFVHDKDIQLYMNAADIIVLPYKDILTSGTTILAMSFGKPIIAPMTGCIIDILDDKGGFLYSTNIESGLYEAMKCALSTDKTTLQNMGTYNLRLVEQFSWKEIGKRTYNIYRECIAK